MNGLRPPLTAPPGFAVRQSRSDSKECCRPALLSERGGISMTEDEAYKVHIQYTFNAFCKVVIRHAAIDKILKLRRRWEREVSLDYLMSEKFVQLAEPE